MNEMKFLFRIRKSEMCLIASFASSRLKSQRCLISSTHKTSLKKEQTLTILVTRENFFYYKTIQIKLPKKQKQSSIRERKNVLNANK